MGDWDGQEEARTDRALATVLRRFGADERPAVLACLLRTLSGNPWAWVAARAGVSEGRAEALSRRGRRILDAAVASGRLERSALAAALLAAGDGDGCAPERRVDPRGPIRASRSRWRRPHSP
jgi:hypothetical protein